jgi:hypothetical protein
MKSRMVRLIFALALITCAVAPTLASAERDGNVEATFTKWIIGPVPDPTGVDMAGVVGGNVGVGSFSAEALSYADDGTTTTIHALYHINGSDRSFVADNLVTQSDATGIAEISGVVRGGPLDGAPVDGAYRTMSTCDVPTPGNVHGTLCFKGTLHVTR